MMKRNVSLFLTVALFFGYIVSASWAELPQSRIGVNKRSISPLKADKAFGRIPKTGTDSKMVFTQKDRERLQKMFARFENRKLLKKPLR